MKLLILLFFLSFGSLKAQMMFFVKPTISIKSYVSSTDDFRFYSDIFSSNPYFKINNKIMSLRRDWNVGFSFGAILKDSKYILEFGYANDQVGTACIDIFNTYQPEDSMYYYDSRRFRSSLYTHRFKFEISKRIKKTFTYFTFGAGLIYNPSGIKNGQFNSSSFSSVGIQIGPQTFMDIYHNTMSGYRFSPTLSFGSTFNLSIKKKRICEVSFVYVQSFRRLASTGNYYFITDDGNKVSYCYGNSTKGSGFVLQLSRRLQVYPWKDRKKERI